MQRERQREQFHNQQEAEAEASDVSEEGVEGEEDEDEEDESELSWVAVRCSAVSRLLYGCPVVAYKLLRRFPFFI